MAACLLFRITYEPLAKCVIYFFPHAGGFYPASSLLLSRRQTGFRLNTLPE
jgi:hypothetical protein